MDAFGEGSRLRALTFLVNTKKFNVAVFSDIRYASHPVPAVNVPSLLIGRNTELWLPMTEYETDFLMEVFSVTYLFSNYTIM